jgi:hypothetical protein
MSSLAERLSSHLHEGSRESGLAFLNSALGHLPLLLNYDPIHLLLGIRYLSSDPARLMKHGFDTKEIYINNSDKAGYIGKEIDASEIPREVKRYAKFSKLAYTKRPFDFLPKIKCYHPSIKMVLQVPSTHFWPEHFLVVDEEEKAIVLVIRGTKELSDFANDAFAMPVPWNKSEHKVHCGIGNVASALLQPGYLDGSEAIGGLWVGGAVAHAKIDDQRLFSSTSSSSSSSLTSLGENGSDIVVLEEEECEAIRDRRGIACVIQMLINHLGGGYSVLCVGHSLGGGVSSLLAMELRRMLKMPLDNDDDIARDLQQTGEEVKESKNDENNKDIDAQCIHSVLVKQNPVYAICYGIPSTTSGALACIASKTHDEIEELFHGKAPRVMKTPKCKWKGAARMHLPMVTSVIVGDDIVPRMSLDSLSHLYRVISDPVVSAEIRQDAAETAVRHFHSTASNFVEAHVPQQAVALVNHIGQHIGSHLSNRMDVVRHTSGVIGNHIGHHIGNHIETVRQSGTAVAKSAVASAVGSSVNFLSSMASQHIQGLAGSATAAITSSVSAASAITSSVSAASAIRSSTLSGSSSSSSTTTTTTTSSLSSVPLPELQLLNLSSKDEKNTVKEEIDAKSSSSSSSAAASITATINENNKDDQEDEDEEDLFTPIKRGDSSPSFSPFQVTTSSLDSSSSSSSSSSPEVSNITIVDSELNQAISLYLSEWIQANVGKDQRLVPPGRVYHFVKVNDEENTYRVRESLPKMFQTLSLSQTYLSDHSCSGYVQSVGE